MNIALWIAQGILALVFLYSGVLKSVWPKPRLIESGQTGVQFVPPPLIRVIGACEILGVLGIILPEATGIAPVLTPIAAIGLGIIMIGAIATHVRLREVRNTAGTVVLLALCIFVAIGRFAGLS